MQHESLFSRNRRAGRDGKPSSACLFYNNRDIGKNRVAMSDDMRHFCSSSDMCLRNLLLNALDPEQTSLVKPLHVCCSVCKLNCKCSNSVQVDLN